MKTELVVFTPNSSLQLGVLYRFSASRMETQQQQPFELLKRKNHNSPEEEEEECEGMSEVSTDSRLFHGYHQSNNKKQRTNNNEVSTTLKLVDESWLTIMNKRADKPVIEEPSETYRRIARMRHYSLHEVREERLKGVSTKLKLFLDPWNIKKRITQSDLGQLCRLLVQTSLVDKHVLPLMNTDSVTKIHGKEGLKVVVWDQDTHSEHKLVFKKWSTSKSYIFINGWCQEFVNRRELKAGDEIGLYWDPCHSRFNFRVFAKALERTSP